MKANAVTIVDIDQAFRQLEFAIKLLCHCELDHLDRSTFDTDVTLLLETENVGFPNGSFKTLESVVMASQIQVGMAFGVSAIVLDAAYETAGVRKNLHSRLAADDLRVFVYIVRCAFAHNVAAPRWQIRGQDFARTFLLPLEDAVLPIDLKVRDGECFEYEHIGGFAQWFKVKNAVIQAIDGAT